jgi:hypothetical protein
MIKLLVTIEEKNKEVYVEMESIDNSKGTNLEIDTFNDIFDLIEYYVIGDEVEDTTNEIISTMKKQGG